MKDKSDSDSSDDQTDFLNNFVKQQPRQSSNIDISQLESLNKNKRLIKKRNTQQINEEQWEKLQIKNKNKKKKIS